ncbi:RecQ family ATP-dependent DNA helicase [Dyadobacter sandarakinus]|uniref:DNA 3'-5' helicase n=1 Tax=Dyadobacter sandarakinus TaxID=2747268 RepID=A0ABX7I6G9_9BACT|nr:DEAD/DEAH box helicase [Dyadobacter sandarakinus]QRR01448.1 DEAD/DEAH box helicase [Dyadobacter sandarakinus]
MPYSSPQALRLLRLGTQNPFATFREDQELAISQIVDRPSRLLLVQKTGWGKSSVYFIATKLLREAGGGPALLISPLLALMRNQIAAANRMGVRARTINSDNQDEWDEVERAIRNNEVDILLISPERLANGHFREKVLGPVASQISMLVIDEAHCISDWGHDFRPHYRLLERIVKTLPSNLRLLATTATANERVMNDLVAVLGPNISVVRGDLNRPSLSLQTIHIPSQAERLAWLAEYVPKIEGHGIIYTLTVRDANLVSSWLKSSGVNVEAYTGESGDAREELEQALLDNRVKALVATMALGMGFDKPDLAFVIHYQLPGSIVAYYQQVGRAGRGIDSARGILLIGEEDKTITNWFIESAFPTPDEVQEILSALEKSQFGLSVPDLMTKVNISKGRIEKTISLLSLESPAPIVKEGSKWQLTVSHLAPEFWERAQRLTALRKEEQAQMEEYSRLESGHMDFLIAGLDGEPNTINASRVLSPLPSTVNSKLVTAAISFLKRSDLPIEPRKQWPTGGLSGYGVSGKINPFYQTQNGKALCIWGDAGWGKLVKEGKYYTKRFDDELVKACVDLILRWKPTPAPVWVTCIPSTRHPELVPDFAARIANELKLPFKPVLIKTDERPAQKAMANSTQQAKNLDGSLAINDQSIPNGPVLLIDDMVDSRWTLTVAAWLLRLKGSGEVWPLALAQTGNEQ